MWQALTRVSKLLWTSVARLGDLSSLPTLCTQLVCGLNALHRSSVAGQKREADVCHQTSLVLEGLSHHSIRRWGEQQRFWLAGTVVCCCCPAMERAVFDVPAHFQP